jgi:hypothetical protein
MSFFFVVKCEETFISTVKSFVRKRKGEENSDLLVIDMVCLGIETRENV